MVEEAPAHQDVPVGYGFRPTDEELVGHYLQHKLLADDPFIHNTISEIDICNHEPWDLPELSVIKSDDPEWFFFSPIRYKYTKSNKSNRATSRGYWKATGKDRKIRDRVTNNVIGTKKTLVFYQGHAPRFRNKWVIHEYHHDLFPQNERTHVLCKLLKKPEKKTKEKAEELVDDKSQPKNRIATEHENQTNPEVPYLSNMDSLLNQRPVESNGSIGCSRIQTPSEVNSIDATPFDDDSKEFDVNSFLLWPDDFDSDCWPLGMDDWK